MIFFLTPSGAIDKEVQSLYTIDVYTSICNLRLGAARWNYPGQKEFRFT
jgi:hypothetical protein